MKAMASQVLQMKIQIETQTQIQNRPSEAVLAGLRESIQEKNHQIATLTAQFEDTKRQLNIAQTDLKTKEQKCAALKRNASNLKRAAGSAKQKWNALRQEANRQQADMKRHRLLLKQQLQTANNNFLLREQELKEQLQVQRKQNRSISKSLQTLKDEKEMLELEFQEQTTPVVYTKEKRGYSTEIQMCAAQLVGELEIAAARVPEVIHCVGKHVFNTEISLEDLPKKTSVFRYVDSAHAVAKMQLQEQMQKNRFDLHTDGTSRCKKSFIGQQITLENKSSLSCGFHRVSTESAETLVDITMALITEIASVTTDDEEEIARSVKQMLKNLNALMSDRASVMKSFDQELDKTRRDILETETGLDFLFCQAHFLLGLSSAAEKTLSKIEQDSGFQSSLGRDRLPAFGHFKKSTSEPAALRALRTTCDVLGPRGDEKSGCRDSWVGFCSHLGIASQITSFRGNRFNNTFEGAAGIIHHLKDILSFVTEYADESPNLKVQSVLADLQDEKIVTMIAALAMVYVCVSGPFWVMINSDVHYLDLYKHVQKMRSSLQQVINNPDQFETHQQNLHSVLDSFLLKETPVVQSVGSFLQHVPNQDLFKQTVTEFSKEFVKVIDRQLSDFLTGGKYSSPPNEEDRQRMAHCRTTNLLGEACFGDLDFSMNKRRSASSFHHSTVNMMKRNKPITAWLCAKSLEDQKVVMRAARRKGEQLRRLHKEKEAEVVREDKKKVLARKKARQEKDKKAAERRKRILRDLASCPLQRACLTKTDVEKLLQAYPTATSRKNALKSQFRYFQIVLKEKSPLLQVGKKDLAELVNNFNKFLENFNGDIQEAAVNDPDSSSDEETHPSQEKRRHRPLSRRKLCGSQHHSESNSDSSSQSGSNAESDIDSTESFDGSFQRQGETVAVHYDQRLYIGEVLQVHDPSKATVTFLCQDLDRNSFYWPSSLDLDEIDKKYVVQWGVELIPNGQRARKWCVQDFPKLQRRHNTYKSQFC